MNGWCDKRALLPGIGIGMALLLASCEERPAATVPQAADEVTLRVMPIGIERELPVMLEAVQRQFPDYKIDIADCRCTGAKQLEEARTRAANGELDLVAFIGLGEVQKWAGQGLLIELTPLLKQSRDETDAVRGIAERAMHQQRLYALPFAMELPLVAVLNLDLFAERHVTPPGADWTWDDFVQLTKQLAQPEKQQWGFSSTMLEFLPLTYATQQTKGYDWVHDTTALRDALPLFQQLLAMPYQVRPATPKQFHEEQLVGGDPVNDFLAGKAAMSLEMTSSLAYYNTQWSFAWDVVPLPQAKEPFTAVNPIAWGIPQTSKQKEAAWNVARYLAGTGAAAVAKSGHLPIVHTDEHLQQWLAHYSGFPAGMKSVYPVRWDALEQWSEQAFMKQYRAAYEALNKPLAGNGS